MSITIKVRDNGPYLIEGEFKLVDAQGNEIPIKKPVLAIPLLALTMLGGCYRPPSSYSTVPPSDTAATNTRRREFGIREIKPTWTFDRRQFGAEDLVEHAGSAGGKRVQRAGGDQAAIIW